MSVPVGASVKERSHLRFGCAKPFGEETVCDEED